MIHTNIEDRPTKYSNIIKYFKTKIINKEIRYGDVIETENELMQKFSVSRHTVRLAFQYLENDGFIKKEQGRGTFCVYSENNHKAIAVVTTYISDYIFPQIIRGIESSLSNKGYSLLLYNTNNEKSKERKILERILDFNVSGLIIEPTKSAFGNTNKDIFITFDEKHIPIVFIDAVYPDLNSSFIIMDDEGGGYMATNYVIQSGHKNIAGIFKNDDLQGVLRQNGFIKALNDNNIPVNFDILGSYDTSKANVYPYEFTSSILKSPKPPTAIVCYNDVAAMKSMQAIKDAGLIPGKDVSITGYDDSYIAASSAIQLTTIKHPQEEMGRRASEYLLDLINKKSKKLSYIYKPELIVRDSVASVQH